MWNKADKDNVSVEVSQDYIPECCPEPSKCAWVQTKNIEKYKKLSYEYELDLNNSRQYRLAGVGKIKEFLMTKK